MKKRLYFYPKGFIDKKTGKKKTGFRPQKDGAKSFVKANFDDIRKGNLPYDNLTAQEKRIYRGLNNRSFENIYTFQGKRFYDPTGAVRFALDPIPDLKGKRNLTNLLSEKDFLSFFDKNRTTTRKIQEALNTSFYEFEKGSKKQYYRDKAGTLLDMVSRLKQFEKQGFSIQVIVSKLFKDSKMININKGDILFGPNAIAYLRNYESDALQEAQADAKPGEQVKLQVVYDEIKINPYRKTILIDTRKAQINDLAETP